VYRDIFVDDLKDIPPIDLIHHRVRLKEGTPVHSTKQRRYAGQKEYWLRRIIQDGIDAGMYEKTFYANGKLSEWNTAPMIVPREGQEQPRLVFDYYWVYEDQPGNWMHNQEAVHNFLSNPSYKLYFQFDIKHAYWSVPIHPDDRYLLAFSVPGMGQYQLTRMLQGERSASFTMTELMHIALGAILPLDPEPSLMYGGERPDVQHCSVFIDNGFGAIGDSIPDDRVFIEGYDYLKVHVLPRLL